MVRPKNTTVGSKRPLWVNEGGFPLVSILDMNIVVSPLYIEFGKDFGVS